MINDRGTKKWTSLMMPEHVEMLNNMWKQLEYKNKPILDEQQIEENVMKLQLAIHNNLTIEVKYFKDHDFHTIKGKLSSIVSNESLVFADEVRTKINFKDVLDVFID